MNILFVSSGNNRTGKTAPFIESQGESLRKKGHNVYYSLVKGHGLKSYFKHSFEIKKDVKKYKIDVIHAHYSLCAFSSLLAFSKKPIVASYMGSDAYGSINKKGKTRISSYWIVLLSLLMQPFLSYIISKSENIDKYVHKKRRAIIPNGVDFDTFQPRTQKRDDSSSKLFTILFLGDTSSERKNFTLLDKAVSSLNDENIIIEAPYPIQAKDIPKYMQNADMLAMTSWEEGSPNVVKEAMACNLPIVATNAGDAWWLLGDLEGHYKTKFDYNDLAKGILEIKKFNNNTKGRDRLIELGLDASMVADKLIGIYETVLKRRF